VKKRGHRRTGKSKQQKVNGKREGRKGEKKAPTRANRGQLGNTRKGEKSEK